jgi:hypothetical protein
MRSEQLELDVLNKTLVETKQEIKDAQSKYQDTSTKCENTEAEIRKL